MFRYFFPLLLISFDANAYIGPGLGLGTIGVVLSFALTFFLAIFGLIWYPIKRFFLKMKIRFFKKKQGTTDDMR